MKNLSLLVMMLFLSFGAFAQVEKEHKKKEKGYEKHVMKEDQEAHAMMYSDKITTRLNLTAEQKEDIKKAQIKRLEAQKELRAEHKEEMDGDMDDMADAKADMQKQRMKIQEDFKEEMKEILNEAQYTKWEAMHEREMKMHGKKKGHKKNKDTEDTDW